MSSSRNILHFFGIAFFTTCVALTIHLLFLSSSSDTKRAIAIYFTVYLGLFSVFKIFKHRNEPGYGISINRAVGGALGFIGGIYGSYLLFILFGVYDDVSSIDSSAIIVGICFCCAEGSRQIGSFLSNALSPR